MADRGGRVGLLLAGAVVAASTVIPLSAAPSYAATCSGSGGVNVVVDRGSLGGGVSTACDSDGAGKNASAVFPDSGFALSYATREPGFVCRVNGAPASDPCVNASPADAYWGLWWSDGESGTWSYAHTGVGGLKVPDGGSVAFAFSDGGGDDPPGVAAPIAPSDSGSTGAGSSGSSEGAGGSGGGASGSPGGTPSSPGGSGSPSGTPSSTPTTGGSSSPSASPSSEALDDASVAGGSSDEATPSSQADPTRQAGDATAEKAKDDRAAAANESDRAKAGKNRRQAAKDEARTGSADDPSASPEAVTNADPVDPASSTPAGLPGWAAPLVLGLLVLTGAVTAVARRRRTG